MKKLLVVLSVFVIFTGFVFGATDTAGQSITVDVGEVALINLANSPLGAFTLTTVTVGGQALVIDETSVDGGDLQFTSTVASAEVSRKITAVLSSKPDWFTLTVELGAIGTNDEGATGSRVGEGPTYVYTLTTSAQDIVTGIGTGWTGTGTSDGYSVTYVGDIVDASVSSMYMSPDAITVTYTLTEDI